MVSSKKQKPSTMFGGIDNAKNKTSNKKQVVVRTTTPNIGLAAKSPVKKSPVKKSPVKKSPVKKSTVKKSPVKNKPPIKQEIVLILETCENMSKPDMYKILSGKEHDYSRQSMYNALKDTKVFTVKSDGKIGLS